MSLVWVFIWSTLNSPPKREEEPIQQNNKIELLKLAFKPIGFVLCRIILLFTFVLIP
jgi:hypothetical protein